jgi:hypothetical protein
MKNEDLNKNKHEGNDMFLQLLEDYDKNIELKLKNDICPLVTSKKIYHNKSYILLSDIYPSLS